jgi:hypothetical protein
MQRTLIIPVLLVVAIALSGCGSAGTQTPTGNANQGTSNAGTTNAGNSSPLNQGSGPQNQGIGGGAPVNGNTRVEPPGVGSSGSIANSNK